MKLLGLYRGTRTSLITITVLVLSFCTLLALLLLLLASPVTTTPSFSPVLLESTSRADSSSAGERDSLSFEQDKNNEHDPPSNANRRPPTRSIPRILHFNYFGGEAAMNAEAAEPRAHFRRDWWRSCKLHNPAWEVVLWDRRKSEAFLQERYPWFLPVFQSLDSIVLQSDALRAFILHSFGGVYLDLDTECFAPIAPSLEGHTLVLQAEEEGLTNNAQMASAAGHPFWWLVIKRAVLAARRGIKDPLYAAGPHALTEAIEEYLGPARTAPLASGTFSDKWVTEQSNDAAAGEQQHTIRVYGTAEFFTPCKWNDWACISRHAKCKAYVRHGHMEELLSNSSSEDGEGREVEQSDTDSSEQSLIRECLQFKRVVGVHHFAGSWLGLDGTKSGWLKDEALQGLTTFLSSKRAFEEHPGCQDKQETQPPSSTQIDAQPQQQPQQQHWMQPCATAVVQRLKQQQGGQCDAISVWRVQPWVSVAGDGCHACEQEHSTQQEEQHHQIQVLRSMLQLGCHTTLVTDAPESQIEAVKNELVDTSLLQVKQAQLSLVSDPHAAMPLVSLGALLIHHTALQLQAPGRRLAMLHVSCPGTCVYESISALHTEGPDVLLAGATQPALLLLRMGALPKTRLHLVHAFYQHLYQESGYLGFSLERLALPVAERGALKLTEEHVLPPAKLSFLNTRI